MDEKPREENTVQVWSAKDLVEFTLIREALEEAGIDNMEVPFIDGAYDDLYVPTRGFADIYVFESDKDEAMKIIQTIVQEEEEDES